MSSFSTYVIGFVILIISLCIAAFLLHVPPMWIAVGAVVLVGMAIVVATTKKRGTRQRPERMGTRVQLACLLVAVDWKTVAGVARRET